MNAPTPKLQQTALEGLHVVLNVPQWFAEPDFAAWLNSDETNAFTWHQRGEAPGEYSDVVILVDPSLSGEGSNDEMPHHDEVVDWLRTRFGERAPGDCHVAVRLTNLQ